MRVVEITRAGPPSVLQIRERPDPMPGKNEVLLRVKASGVNFADVMGRMGLYPDAPPIPYVPGYEVSGLDPDGRRVVAVTRFNGYADRVVVRKEQVFPLPDHLTFEEGAALPVNYLTAWVAMVKLARVAAGERILVEQGAGGVGLAALQVAIHLGAQVYSVVGSEEKCRFVRERGATPILRGKEEWPKGLDLILDPTGMSGLGRDLRHLAPGGRVVLFGASEFVRGPKRNLFRTAWKYLFRPRIDPVRLMYLNRGIFGLNLIPYWKEIRDLTEAVRPLLDGVREGWLKPHVGATFPLDRAADAHTFLHDRRNIGKVVLTI